MVLALVMSTTKFSCPVVEDIEPSSIIEEAAELVMCGEELIVESELVKCGEELDVEYCVELSSIVVVIVELIDSEEDSLEAVIFSKSKIYSKLLGSS